MGININVPNQINQNTPLRPVRSGATAEPDYSVKYTPQDLTEAQQAQARQNIGAGTSDFSGSYNDLTDKPTIPAAQVQSDWNQTDDTAVDYIKNKPGLFSGDYNDLTNKPNESLELTMTDEDGNVITGTFVLTSKTITPAS